MNWVTEEFPYLSLRQISMPKFRVPDSNFLHKLNQLVIKCTKLNISKKNISVGKLSLCPWKASVLSALFVPNQLSQSAKNLIC